jgi:hypothetical protein
VGNLVKEDETMGYRLRTSALVLLILAVIGPSLLLADEPTWIAPAGATDANGQQFTALPLRWCAMENTSVANNPTVFPGETETDGVLWRRHERATDRIWTPGARITFRSAIESRIMQDANFPVINDPVLSTNPPSQPTGPGQKGDVLDPDFGSVEFDAVRAACEKAWSDKSAQWGVPNVGIIAVSIRRFVKADGTPTTKWGKAVNSFNSPQGSDICRNPSVLTANNGAILVVDHDPNITGGLDDEPDYYRDAKLVAHELGHVIGLAHGNGRNDPNTDPAVFDEVCDSAETNNNPATIMFPQVGPSTDTVTSDQRARAQAFANVTSGHYVDPPATMITGPTVSDLRSDVIEDVASRAVDMTGVRITRHEPRRTTVLSHNLFGLINETENYQYLVFLDLDADPNTGGRPEDLGFPTLFQGAEVVTRVAVQDYTPVPTVWVFDGSDFVAASDERIVAAIEPAIEGESGQAVFDVVSLSMPDSIAGPIRPTVRFQAIAEMLAPESDVDVLPGGRRIVPTGNSDSLYPIPAQYPLCAMNPPQVDPGDTATVEVTGFNRPFEPIHVVFGDQMVGQGTLDGAGEGATDFAVPNDARPGPRLITVGVDGTALTADCLLQVGGERDAETAEATEPAATPVP